MNIKRFFSFDWLLNPNKELRNEVNQLIQEIKKKNEDPITVKYVAGIDAYKIEKPYKNLYFSGNNITVILNEGEVLSSECDLEKYAQIKESKTKEEILSLLYSKENKKEEYVIAKNDLAILEVNSDFEVVGTKVYLKPCKLEIPEIVKSTFIEILEKKLAYSSKFHYSIEDNFDEQALEEQYQSLKQFWYKLALNPMQESREQLLSILKKYNVSLTSNGNFLGYRRILSKSAKNKDLVEFVSKEYFKIKQWKKSPKNYEIYKDENNKFRCTKKGEIYQDNYLGNLYELYIDLPNLQEMTYTDNHTETYDIKVGDVYRIKEEDIDLNKYGSCGGSLHVSVGKNHYDYTSFGDTDVLVVINPMHFYKTDTGCSGKFGVKEMFIACTVEIDENGNYLNVNEGDINNFDEEYHNITISELQEVIKTKDFSSLSVQENVPLLSLPDLKDIVNVLQNKIVKI